MYMYLIFKNWMKKKLDIKKSTCPAFKTLLARMVVQKNCGVSCPDLFLDYS